MDDEDDVRVASEDDVPCGTNKATQRGRQERKIVSKRIRENVLLFCRAGDSALRSQHHDAGSCIPACAQPVLS